MAEANTAVHGENQVERRLVRPREIAAYALTSYGLNNLTTYVGSTKQYFMMSFLGLSGSTSTASGFITRRMSSGEKWS